MEVHVDQSVAATAPGLGRLLSLDVIYRITSFRHRLISLIMARCATARKQRLQKESSWNSESDSFSHGLMGRRGERSIDGYVSATVVDHYFLLQWKNSLMTLSTIFPMVSAIRKMNSIVGSTDWTIFCATVLDWTRLHILASGTIGA